jgi:putative glycerol-1-phosphate prenyltransferase
MEMEMFRNRKTLALLLDPDKVNDKTLPGILKTATEVSTDFIMVGGSLTFRSIENVIDLIRSVCSVPVVLFPGNLLQLSRKADMILLLSLISGRNPELLIGNHVIAAPYLKDVKEKVIPVGYILIGCGSKTSVEYISQTEAIPSEKIDIVVATAIAGEMLGLRMIYLEAGSGASTTVPVEIIKSVRKEITVPLAVGGGITTSEEVKRIYSAGADLIILGNGCEKDPGLLTGACRQRDEINKITNGKART